MNDHPNESGWVDSSRSIENRNRFPKDVLVRYAGQHVAWNLDCTHILASGRDIAEVESNLRVAGIQASQVIFGSIDPPDIDSDLGGLCDSPTL